MFSSFARGLVARFAGYGCIGLGFWLLYRGFSDENIGVAAGLGIGGAASILVGLYLAVSLARRDSPPTSPQLGVPAAQLPEEVVAIDPVYGSNQGS